jgi:hypothetical protein
VLNNPYLIALGIPLILIACGAFARKLVRGSNWQRSDFFLGVELALAAMASALVYVFDLAKLSSSAQPMDAVARKIAATATFLALCFFLLLWVLTTHQDWEKRPHNRMGQIIWLGFLANFVGAALLAAFVLLVKGI